MYILYYRLLTVARDKFIFNKEIFHMIPELIFLRLETEFWCILPLF